MAKINSNRFFIVIGTLMLIASFMSGCTKQMSGEDIYKSNKDSIGKIESYLSSGSAFIIDKEKGLIVTNYHVVSLQGRLEYINDQNENFDINRILYASKEYDIAIMKVDTEFNSEVIIENSRIGEVGDKIYVISSPLGTYTNTFSEGIISSTRLIEEIEYYQITADISEGSSGGALINEQGKVIGITSMGVDNSNINFALRIDQEILSNIERYKNSTKDNIDSISMDIKEFYFREGNIIDGEYIGDVIEYTNNLKPQYVGKIENNKYEGKGSLYDRDARTIYNGKFKNGLYHYYGKLEEVVGLNPARIIYQGEFNSGEYDGRGTEYYRYDEIKSFYDEYKNLYLAYRRGEFDTSKINDYMWKWIINYSLAYGLDNLENYDESFLLHHDIAYKKPGATDEGLLKYDGDYVEGLYYGEGKLYNLEGELIFEGNFKNGKYHGYGKEYDSNMEIIHEGEWVNGIKQ